jgi:hypothetical protein
MIIVPIITLMMASVLVAINFALLVRSHPY